tara:strand:- start:575 stop:1021 length:447 start_codon:yes stop_codon:yes gene_type:complete
MRNFYENPTFKFYNFEQAKLILECVKKIETDVNIIYSFSVSRWQGPLYVNNLFKILNNKKVLYIAECDSNVGTILSFFRAGIKKIALEIQDKKIKAKINELALQYNCTIINISKFNSIFDICEELDLTDLYVKKIKENLKKYLKGFCK